MKLSPVLEGMRTYPFVRLTEAKRRLAEQGVEYVDFGMGEPREETPLFIREALAAALEPLSTYPLAEGLPELREAIAGWIARRFGARVDPGTQVVPTLGSKEAIFHMAQVVGGDVVAVTTPGYPVPERGALFAGRAVVELPLRADAGFLPDLDAVDWSAVGLLWLCYPNNPTAATAPLELYERAAELARRHDFVLASDEAYSELYFGDEPPVSALQIDDLRNVAVLNTLSKRSSMPGYRSGFVAGDPELVAALKRYRPNVGVAPQEFVQRASVAAWGDEAHVEEVRAGSTGPSATWCCRRSRPRASATPAATPRSSSGSTPARTPRPPPRGCSSAGSCSRRGRSSARAGSGSCGSRWCPRSPSAGGRWSCSPARPSAAGSVTPGRELLVRVQDLVEAAPRAGARQGLHGARLRVAPEQQVVGA